MKKRKLVTKLNCLIAQNNRKVDQSYMQGVLDGRIEMAEYVIELLTNSDRDGEDLGRKYRDAMVKVPMLTSEDEARIADLLEKQK